MKYSFNCPIDFRFAVYSPMSSYFLVLLNLIHNLAPSKNCIKLKNWKIYSCCLVGCKCRWSPTSRAESRYWKEQRHWTLGSRDSQASSREVFENTIISFFFKKREYQCFLSAFVCFEMLSLKNFGQYFILVLTKSYD